MSTKDSKGSNLQTTRRERVSFPFFCLGKGITFAFISGYLMLYLTDSLLIPAFIVSAILLLSKAWDAINDPLFGIIVDRVNFKSGKFVPWLRVGVFLIPVTALLIFVVPNSAPLGGRVAMAMITYLLWDMSFTMSDVTIYSVITAMTGNVNERTRMIGNQGIVSLLSALIINVLIVPRLETWGFRAAGIIIATISLCGMLVFPFVVKERNREKIVSDDRFKMRDILEYVRKNKYMLYYYAFICIFGMFTLPLSSYVIKHCLGSLEYVAFFTLCAAPVVAILLIIVPTIAKKVDRMKIFKFFIIILFGSCIGMYFGGYSNPVIYGIFWVIQSSSLLVAATLLLMFVTDFIEYGHYVTGMRKEGITVAVQSFANKFVAATASALGALALGIIGYNAETIGQNPEMLDQIFALACWSPPVGILVGSPFLLKCKFLTKDIQIMADVNNATISREEGEALLTRRYE